MNLDVPVASKNLEIWAVLESYFSQMSRSTSRAANSVAHRGQGLIHTVRAGLSVRQHEAVRTCMGKHIMHLIKGRFYWALANAPGMGLQDQYGQTVHLLQAIWIFTFKYKQRMPNKMPINWMQPAEWPDLFQLWPPLAHITPLFKAEKVLLG